MSHRRPYYPINSQIILQFVWAPRRLIDFVGLSNAVPFILLEMGAQRLNCSIRNGLINCSIEGRSSLRARTPQRRSGKTGRKKGKFIEFMRDRV